MSAVAYRISAILFHSGIKYDDIKRLHNLLICMSPDTYSCENAKKGLTELLQRIFDLNYVFSILLKIVGSHLNYTAHKTR